MKKQAFNPFLPGWEYIPDGEPHIFGDRVYLYGSHDRFDGNDYCQNNYVCWSAPVDDLSDWYFHGQIYDIKDDPFNKDGEYCGYAPDCCQGHDGRFYLYYALNNHLAMSVAVSDTPAGKYTFLGHVKTPDGRVWGTKENDAYVFDPGILIDDDGSIHLYMGFSPTDGMTELTEHLKRWNTDGCHHIELCEDMVTMKSEPTLIAPGCTVSKNTSFFDHAFFEAPSMRKFFGKYYFIYSSEHFQELCYAIGDTPVGPFEYKGRLVSNGDIGIDGRIEPINHIGNNHGSLIEIRGKYYIFYHRHTNNTGYSRQACAEEIKVNSDNTFVQSEITSCGLNDGPLSATGEYSFGIACNISATVKDPPFITQNGEDRDHNDDQFITNMNDGTFVGFKYFDFKGEERIFIRLKSMGEGTLEICHEPASEAIMSVLINKDSLDVYPNGKFDKGIKPLYFRFRGTGFCDLISFKFLTGENQ